jgi:hypothetical protein
LADMIKVQVAKEWRIKNFAQGTGTKDLFRGVFKRSDYLELLEVKNRIDRFAQMGLNTNLWLSVRHSSWIHVLEAVSTSNLSHDGSFVITLWNDKFVEVHKAYATLTVAANGDLTYDDGIEVRNVNAAGITRENDGEIIHIAQKIQQFCKENINFCPLK